MQRKTLFRPVVALLVVLAAVPAFATGEMAARTLTQSDKARLAAFNATREAAIAEARAGGTPADIATLDQALGGSAQPILGVDIRGNYRCRTIKLGGMPPLTVYGWFQCRVDEDSLGYRLVKTTGSQRLSGHFIDDTRTRLLYFGASHYADEKPKAYKSDADSDQVGYFVKVGPGRYRLELPSPKYESKFDIIELAKR